MRNVSVITFVLLVTVSYGFYQLQHQVEIRQDRVGELQAQIVQDREDIAILKAEWALLNNPKRLQTLSNKFLELAPIDPTQIRSVDDLAMRENGVQGAAFVDPATEDNTAPVAVAGLPPKPKPALPTVSVAVPLNTGGTP